MPLGSLFHLLTMPFLRPVLRPVTRFIVGLIAIPIFRLFLRRMVDLDRLDKELSKDLEQWFRGSLLLLVASANAEQFLFNEVSFKFSDQILTGLRLMLAIGVIETMPDVDLFPIIYAGPSARLFARGKSWSQQSWMFCKGMLCRHLDRSSAVFAILTTLYDGSSGWIFYFIAITQFLIIGLVTSRAKAVDVLSEFDQQIQLRRQELVERELGMSGAPRATTTPVPLLTVAAFPDPELPETVHLDTRLAQGPVDANHASIP